MTNEDRMLELICM